MTLVWINKSSWILLSRKKPLDIKGQTTTVERLAMTQVQRYLWMVTFDKTLQKHKVLINDPVWDVTTESDWEDFGGWTPVVLLKSTDDFQLMPLDIANWYVDLVHTPDQSKIITLTIWGLTNYDYTIITNRLTFWPSLDLAVWDEIDVNYYY